MKRLYYLRHGQSVMNVTGHFAGRENTPLTDKGRKQARHAAKAAQKLNIDYIITSPLIRARETAEIIAQGIGYPTNKIDVNNLLVERDYGKFTNTPWRPDLNLDDISDIETIDSVRERAHLALQHLRTLPGENILMVSHGTFGRALRSVIHSDIPFASLDELNNAEIVQML